MAEKLSGYTIVLKQKETGREFIAYVEDGKLPDERAFFKRHAEAIAALKDLRAHGFAGRVVKVIATLTWEPLKRPQRKALAKQSERL